MKSKQLVRAMLTKIPADVTLTEIASWVNTVELSGIQHAEEFDAELEKDMAAFFSKRQRAAPGASAKKDASAKEKVLHMLSKLPEDVGPTEILNRLVLLRKIEVGLNESERGEGITVHHGARLFPGDLPESE